MEQLPVMTFSNGQSAEESSNLRPEISFFLFFFCRRRRLISKLGSEASVAEARLSINVTERNFMMGTDVSSAKIMKRMRDKDQRSKTENVKSKIEDLLLAF
jgi:hypothetical protein